MDNSNTGARSAPSSPSVAMPLGTTGIAGKVMGVTRIGSRAGLIAIGVLAAIVLAIVYGISSSGNHRTGATPVTMEPQILPTTGPGFDNIPGANPTPYVAAAPRMVQHQGTARVRQIAPSKSQSRYPLEPILSDPATQSALQRSTDVPDIHAMPQALPPVQLSATAPIDGAKALKLEHARQALQIAELARHAGILVSTQSNAVAPVEAHLAPTGVVSAAPAMVTTPAANADADPALASQRAKSEFVSLQKSTTANDYLAAPRQASISRYEVQAGSIIPAILVTGINSDLPGTMIGQVSQDVYDSKTGTLLLIPAGSKLVGRYDSQVTNGQSRVLVAWQRILFPDASFIDINGMAGADTAGYSGFTGKVDDHSGKLFRNAILFSLIGAGATLLQPRTAIAALTTAGTMVQAPSVGSQIAGQVGMQLSQVAQQSTNKGLQQQPTIEVRPGYLFNIMVDRDLVLPGPYNDVATR